jgi:PAS domain S-box-containing protein
MSIERDVDEWSYSGLRPAHEELVQLFALSHDFSCVLGLDGRFGLVNPAWRDSLGWTLDELLARPFLDFVHPDDRMAVEKELSKIAGGGAIIGFETRICSQNGGQRRLKWNAVCLPTRKAICVAARDVTEEKQIEHALIEAGDRVKERIGRELHDGLCQNLAGIAALSATLARKLAARNDPAAPLAAEITALLQQAIGDARDFSRGLNPVGLAKMGLAAALEVLAANVEALHPVTCAFACGRRFPRLDPAVEVHLYRIAQEAVNNAIVHGRGKRIEISLRVRVGRGSLSIRDNGVGIDGGALAIEGIGLHTMKYRARLIGASLRVQSATPGTIVVCVFRCADRHSQGAKPFLQTRLSKRGGKERF